MSSLIKGLFLPGTFILILAVIGVLFFKTQPKRSSYFMLAGLVIFYLFSITPVADGLLNPLEGSYEKINQEKILELETEKIVVLAGGRKADVLRGAEALRIFNLKNESPEIIISGPKKPTGDTSEIKRFFIDRGVPTEKIILEEDSETTRENLKNIAGKLGEEPFFLVTSGYHMRRAMEEVERRNLEATPAPADFRRKGDYSFSDFIPNAYNLRKSELATYEHLGRLYYLMTFD